MEKVLSRERLHSSRLLLSKFCIDKETSIGISFIRQNRGEGTPLCLGTMNFGNPTDETESIAIINRALEGGINFIDTANVYNAGESERIVGQALKGNGQRDQVVLATKVYGKMGEGPNDQGVSRYHLIKACEDSLRRLQTDHIDLYQLHRPPLTVPQDEVLRTFDDLIRAGKVRYIGCSTHPAWLVMEALAISEKYHLARYVSEQPPYNLLDRRIENELIPLCQKHNLASCPGRHWREASWQVATRWMARYRQTRGPLDPMKSFRRGLPAKAGR